jgi:glycosylphosphatidylinositol transamidase (GPIT) subunit GPI8
MNVYGEAIEVDYCGQGVTVDLDPAICVHIIDQYTYYGFEFLKSVTQDSNKRMSKFLEICPAKHCH